MSNDAEVRIDLENMKGNKIALMQKYSERQQAIIKHFGGNFSDIPIDRDSEYNQLQDKINILHRMV